MRTRSEILAEVRRRQWPVEQYLKYTSEKLMDMLACDSGLAQVMQVPVMLAKSVRHLTPPKFERLIYDTDYYAQPKWDGNRAKIHILKDCVIVDSRHRSDVDFVYVVKTDNFPWLQSLPKDFPLWQDSILDCEMIAPRKDIATIDGITTSWVTAASAIFNSDSPRALELQHQYGRATFRVLDVIRFQGRDLYSLGFRERWNLWETSDHAVLAGYGILSTPTGRIGSDWPACRFFKEWYQSGWEAFEGVILRHGDGLYPTTANHRTAAMYKWKLGKEIDCFYIGAVPGEGEFSGLIGSVELGVYKDGKIVKISAAAPGSMGLRIKMTKEGSMGSELNDQYMGQVVRCSFQEWTRNGLMRHAVIDYSRQDKSPQECLWEPPVNDPGPFEKYATTIDPTLVAKRLEQLKHCEQVKESDNERF